ncbi:MAG: signal peptidase I [Acidimicrobiaceae bacterium]|nr:signal peptidase I [Acidimicrobiaceae bacterium]
MTARHFRSSDLNIRAVIGRIAMVAAITVIVVTLAGTALFLLRGGRLFVIQSPSMGSTAPIGSLVATTPVPWSSLHVGDVITFHPPTDLVQTYTHRIVSISARGIETRGDVNSATDGWLIHPANLVGRASLILPAMGWVVEMMPWLLVGSALVWWIAGWIEQRQWRDAARHLGIASVALILVRVFHPLFRVIVLGFGSSAHGDQVHIVSEGLLPIRAVASGGAHSVLSYGQSRVVSVVPMGSHHLFTLSEQVFLPVTWLITILAISFSPFLWRLLVRPLHLHHPAVS